MKVEKEKAGVDNPNLKHFHTYISLNHSTPVLLYYHPLLIRAKIQLKFYLQHKRSKH
jgi:hypothetical protein